MTLLFWAVRGVGPYAGISPPVAYGDSPLLVEGAFGCYDLRAASSSSRPYKMGWWSR